MAPGAKGIRKLEGWGCGVEYTLVSWNPGIWEISFNVISTAFLTISSRKLTLNSSIIIDELRGLVSQPETYIAFFYFDYRVQGDQTAAHVLSSLLRQIVSTMPELPQSIIDVYEKAHDSTPLLPLHELEKLILNIALTIPRLYIIIDALDECDGSEHRRNIIQFVRRMKQVQNIRAFVTSRQYPLEINDAFRDEPQIIIRAHESDLMRYIQKQLDRCNEIEFSDGVLAAKITETLVGNAQGM